MLAPVISGKCNIAKKKGSHRSVLAQLSLIPGQDSQTSLNITIDKMVPM
jgi:hypothetical protein